jgi:hypothetical protein
VTVLQGEVPGVTFVVAAVSATGTPPTSRTRIETDRTLAGMYAGDRRFVAVGAEPGAGIVKVRVAAAVGPAKAGGVDPLVGAGRYDPCAPPPPQPAVVVTPIPINPRSKSERRRTIEPSR